MQTDRLSAAVVGAVVATGILVLFTSVARSIITTVRREIERTKRRLRLQNTGNLLRGALLVMALGRQCTKVGRSTHRM
jgi:hypothetical protein